MLTIALLLAVLGAVFPMASGAMVCDKTRVLVNASVVSGTQNTPTGFTYTAATGRTVHAGDMQGAFIGAIEIVVSGFSGTSITPTFETSHDGTTWTTWFAGSAITAAGTTTYKAEDDFESPKRFIRAAWVNAGAGTGTVTINVRYAQVGARGSYAPPGVVDRY